MARRGVSIDPRRRGRESVVMEEKNETTMETQESSDPIDELLRDLRADGRPSLAWVVRWSQGGGDPVANAWNAPSVDPWAMRDFVWFMVHKHGWEERFWSRVGLVESDAALGDNRDPVPMRAAFRRALPVPPTLRELMTVG
jgi:hypothetical protein